MDQLNIPRQPLTLRLRNGKMFEASLPINPFIGGANQPVVLVPSDILRDLPISSDWDDVADAAAHNADLRMRVNDQVARLWEKKSQQGKDDIRRFALSGKSQFELVLEMIRGANPTAYDMAADRLGELVWRKLATSITSTDPFKIEVPQALDLAGVCSVVEQIIEQFRFLIEERRLSEELYHGGRPRPERAAQRLFFAVAYAYCKANNLDLTPEAETGAGPVDFKVSSGFAGRVLVEIKLSTNGKVVKGYTRQLETYKGAEETQKGYYVVLDVGNMGRKADALIATKNDAAQHGKPVSSVMFIDGGRRLSASKL